MRENLEFRWLILFLSKLISSWVRLNPGRFLAPPRHRPRRPEMKDSLDAVNAAFRRSWSQTARVYEETVSHRNVTWRDIQQRTACDSWVQASRSSMLNVKTCPGRDTKADEGFDVTPHSSKKAAVCSHR